jgi:ubiquinone/menaquinone biosynthesis C-methylase UbiE
MDTTRHWDEIYAAKAPEAVSWFQAKPSLSLELITRANADRDAHIFDAGSGASFLIDALLDTGHTHITALDIAAQALNASKKRLGARAALVNWVVADLTRVRLPRQSVDVWHDRAVFHFLKRTCDR